MLRLFHRTKSIAIRKQLHGHALMVHRSRNIEPSMLTGSQVETDTEIVAGPGMGVYSYLDMTNVMKYYIYIRFSVTSRIWWHLARDTKQTRQNTHHLVHVNSIVLIYNYCEVIHVHGVSIFAELVESVHPRH